MTPREDLVHQAGQRSAILKQLEVLAHLLGSISFWGKNTEVLFDEWPGTSMKMYWVCLGTIFVVSALSEWISRCGVMKAGPASFSGGLVQTVMYTVKAGLSYLIILAVMSFNGGVFLAATTGFVLRFMIFGSRSFKETSSNNTHTEIQSHC